MVLLAFGRVDNAGAGHMNTCKMSIFFEAS